MNRECCVCGGCAPSNKQWHNRDDGYAVCARCFLESVTKIGWLQSVDYYGVPGIHHSIGSEGIWDAAPELLEACKFALTVLTADSDSERDNAQEIDLLCLAIAKAEGAK